MKEILKYSYDPYHIDLISFFVAMVGLIISIWQYKQNPKLKPLFFFFLGYVLDLFINHVIIQSTTLITRYQYLVFYVDFVDTIVEFLAFYFLIKNHIVNVKIQKLLNLLLPLFLSVIFIDFICYKITHTEIGQYFM
jgi:hypothetical protein